MSGGRRAYWQRGQFYQDLREIEDQGGARKRKPKQWIQEDEDGYIFDKSKRRRKIEKKPELELTLKQTPKQMPKQTQKQTPEQTQKQTPEQTQKQTQKPTLKPTPIPTSIPTSLPTPIPTPKLTPKPLKQTPKLNPKPKEKVKPNPNPNEKEQQNPDPDPDPNPNPNPTPTLSDQTLQQWTSEYFKGLKLGILCTLHDVLKIGGAVTGKLTLFPVGSATWDMMKTKLNGTLQKEDVPKDSNTILLQSMDHLIACENIFGKKWYEWERFLKEGEDDDDPRYVGKVGITFWKVRVNKQKQNKALPAPFRIVWLPQKQTVKITFYFYSELASGVVNRGCKNPQQLIGKQTAHLSSFDSSQSDSDSDSDSDE
jgi:hypothetical protein